MSRSKAKTPGWAAFDPKKKQNRDNESDPFPPISNVISNTLHQSENLSRNDDHVGKSFSSVLAHSQTEMMDFGHVENNVSRLYQKLKEIHPWAHDNLIEDIMEAVDNDFDRASSLLTEMASHGSLQETQFVKNVEEVSSNIHNDELLDSHNVSIGLLMDMSMIPVEPEWEDDDVYLAHRKDAIRSMRLASRHSKAATEAYLRRDHAAAQELSFKAREEWSNAEKLNAKAAKEILAIQNCGNDDWKLDLHGLHAAEAVQVLIEHLLKIESRVSKRKDLVRQEIEQSDKQQLARPRLLEVVTGKGNHSRGEASLPVAIKSFLSEKGYYHYETRAGVITVQPKFRQLLTPLSNS